MIIGVTGGKGGTGKSTVATALAVELGKKYKVLLVDMDVECPNDHLILDIPCREVKKVHERIPRFSECSNCGLCGKACRTNAIIAIKGSKPFLVPQQCNGCGACKIVCPDKTIEWDQKEVGVILSGKGYGIDLLSGQLKISEPVAEIIVNELKAGDISKYDYVIFDTAAGTKCDVASALRSCDRVFAVTEPTPLGEHDVELIIRLLQRQGKPFEVILNRHELGNEKIIAKMLSKYNKQVYAFIPYSRKIMEQYSRGVPVEDDSIKRIAGEIEK